MPQATNASTEVARATATLPPRQARAHRTASRADECRRPAQARRRRGTARRPPSPGRPRRHLLGGLPAALAGSRSVLSLGLAGHGLSPVVSRPRPIEDYADDVAAAIRQAGGRRAAVVGLSFCGMAARVLALRHLDAVSALVPCGCGGDFAEEVRPMLRERGLDAERDGMAAVLEPTSSAGSRRASGTTPRWTGFPPAHRPRGDDLPRHPRGALHAAA